MTAPKMKKEIKEKVIEQLKEILRERFVNAEVFDSLEVENISGTLFYASAGFQGTNYYEWNFYLSQNGEIVQYEIDFVL